MLWTMVVLALLGTVITAAGRSEARLASNLLAAANAQAAADGAVAVAAFHLLDDSPAHWEPGGAVRRLVVGSSTVLVTMTDERGKIDPNDAPPGLVAAMMKRVGVEGGLADKVSSAITDWRSVNDVGLGPAYVAAGLRYGPPHAPFESLDELGMVLGMTPQLLALMRPHMSLYIEQTPDLSRADPVVTAAIAEAVRRGQLTLNEGEQPGPLIVTVVATATNAGATFTRIALLRMNGIANQPYEILDWK